METVEAQHLIELARYHHALSWKVNSAGGPGESVTLIMTIKNIARINALLFFFFWLLVLYAGADHPPPPGFIFIILLILACALPVYYRVPTYIDWQLTGKEHRFLFVLRDGFLAGVTVAFITMLSFAGRVILGGGVDGIPSLGETLIWFAVLAGMGIVNAVVIYFANVFFVNRRMRH